jgi:hypothetical protein
MRGSSLWLILPLALIPVLWLIPTRSHRDPIYDVWVVSYPDHHPLAGVEVTLKYGLDDPQTLTSDTQGHVRFESRVVWNSLAHRFLTRPSVKTSPGATSFATIKAVGRGFSDFAETGMSWNPARGDIRMRISLSPLDKPAAAAGQHPATN